MKIIVQYLPIVLFFITTFTTAARAENVCKVTDPTGTPLNIRSTPNGEKVFAIQNDSVVRIYEEASDNKGRPWAKIGVQSKDSAIVFGWVFREFISCYNR